MPSDARASLTRLGRAVGIAGIAGIAVGFLLGVAELEMSGAIAVLLVVAARTVLGRVAARHRRGAVTVDRELANRRVEVGDELLVRLAVEIRGAFGLPAVVEDPLDERSIRFTLPSSGAGPERRLAHAVPTRRRGLIRFGDVEIIITDPFGLAASRCRVPAPAEALVVPRCIDLEVDPPAGSADPAGNGGGRTLATHSDEFDALRDYVPGDDVRHVHWPSTARLGRPMVRRHEQRTHRRTTVVLDALTSEPGADDADERAVSAATSVLHAAYHSGDVVRLITAAGTDSGIIDDPRRLDATVDRLATLGASPDADVHGPLRSAARSDRIVVCANGLSPAALGAAMAAAASNSATLVVIETSGGAIQPPLATHAGAATATHAALRVGSDQPILIRFVAPEAFRRQWAEQIVVGLGPGRSVHPRSPRQPDGSEGRDGEVEPVRSRQ